MSDIDIVERLRFCENYEWSPLMREAAAEIERLRALTIADQGLIDMHRAWLISANAEIERLRALNERLGATVNAQAEVIVRLDSIQGGQDG